MSIEYFIKGKEIRYLTVVPQFIDDRRVPLTPVVSFDSSLIVGEHSRPVVALAFGLAK